MGGNLGRGRGRLQSYRLTVVCLLPFSLVFVCFVLTRCFVKIFKRRKSVTGFPRRVIVIKDSLVTGMGRFTLIVFNLFSE